jgi:hypothetical protein
LAGPVVYMDWVPRKESYCDIHPGQVLHCRACDGKKGGRKTARIHAHELSKWGKAGGRPKKKAGKRAKPKGPKASH